MRAVWKVLKEVEGGQDQLMTSPKVAGSFLQMSDARLSRHSLGAVPSQRLFFSSQLTGRWKHSAAAEDALWP